LIDNGKAAHIHGIHLDIRNRPSIEALAGQNDIEHSEKILVIMLNNIAEACQVPTQRSCYLCFADRGWAHHLQGKINGLTYIN